MPANSFRKLALLSGIALSVFLTCAGGQGFEQGPPAAQPDPQAPTPRTADGHPDLSGMWRPAPGPGGRGGNAAFTQLAGPGRGNNAGADAQSGDGYVETEMGARDGSVVHLEQDASQMMRADQNKPWYKPEYWAKVRELDETGARTPLDPGFGCRNPGLPRLGAPAEIIQEPGKVILIYQQSALVVREVPTDGRPLPKPDDYDGVKPMGVSSARWDGDTLVIETVDPAPGWLGPTGWFYSPEVKFTEKLHRAGNTLAYDITVEDPIFLKPWVLPQRRLVANSTAGAFLQEPNLCAERDGEHLVGEGEKPSAKN